MKTAAAPGLVAGPGTGPEALIREARQRQHRRWLAAGLAAMVIVAAGAAALIAGSGAGDGAQPPGRHARPTAQAHRPPAARATVLTTASQTRLPRRNSLSLAVGYHAVWVTGIGVTYEVSEDTGRVVRTISTPGTEAAGCGSGVAAGAGAVWVTHGCRGVYRIDPRSGRVTASLRVPDAGDAIAAASGLVWVANYHGDLLRIQPRTGKIVGKPVHVGFGDWALVPAGGALWVTSYGSGFYEGFVSRVDLSTGAVRQFGNHNVEAAGAGSLWTPDVQRIDPTTSMSTATIPVRHGLQIVFWKGSAWALTLRRSLTFQRIDPATNQVTGTPVAVGKPVPAASDIGPTAIAAGPSGLWVLDYSRNLLFHLVMRPARALNIIGQSKHADPGQPSPR